MAKIGTDIYINRSRVPVRLNGWTRHLLAEFGFGLSKPINKALMEFFNSEEDVLDALNAHCKQHNVSRTWMIEFVVTRWLLSAATCGEREHS